MMLKIVKNLQVKELKVKANHKTVVLKQSNNNPSKPVIREKCLDAKTAAKNY